MSVRLPVVELTDAQKATVADLEAQGLSHKDAVDVATRPQLDVPIDGSGPLDPLPPLLDE